MKVRDLGALIALIGMAAAGLIAWGSTQSDVKGVKEDVSALKPQMQQVREDRAADHAILMDIQQAVHEIRETHR